MENEKNNFSGVSVNELVIVSTHQRTGEDGKKKGYSFYEKGEIGVVIAISESEIKIKKSNADEELYGYSEDYYYTVGQASEISFKEEIEKAIKNKEKEIDRCTEERNLMVHWYDDFNNSISLLGKLKKFLKYY